MSIPDAMSVRSAIVAEVLLPLALAQAYTYGVPEGLALAPGDYVEVPLGPRSYIGVVWEVRPATPTNMKLRDVTQRFDMVAMPEAHRTFIEWLSNYYLEPMGNVLRMVLRVPSAFEPPREQVAYRIGDAPPKRMTPQRQRVLEIARDGFAMQARELANAAGVGTSVIKAMAKDGALQEVSLPALRPFAEPDPDAEPYDLTPDQIIAADALRAAVAAQKHSVTLLDGVTGSGKTEVYFEAMAEALRRGKQVLLLLPEIALTAPFLARVERRFGVEPAGWHSDLRPRERERTWRGVADGSAKIVVGARSALFLPWANPGLIIVDEEHESAYKQDDGVTYHARDMAVLYGNLAHFPVILSSATPSLESLVNVDRGRYASVKLRDRHGRPELPEVKLIDMRTAAVEMGAWLSAPLLEQVKATLESGDQALLFLNRRGYAPLTLCRACGHHLDCPNCAASMVEHRFRRLMQCHHCGHQEPVPQACPKCGTEGKLVPVGPGVERLAEEAMKHFPEARLAILSSDITRGQLLKDVLRDVADGVCNLVIGTQLVAKGHHFPFLTCVGVVDADLALESSDPRAGERTWALLAQVAGRAGRGEKPGRAYVQTHSPEHALMRALKSGERDSYLEQEKLLRQSAGLPPYGRLAALIISADDAQSAERFARQLGKTVPPTDDVQVLGPAIAPISVIRGRHRWRLLVKAARSVDIQAFLKLWIGEVKPKGSLSLQVDVDPYN
ncbi:MAG: primosomal protein N', partial [Phyllobacteriaceae bacterium]|nr:primosomal protein N' [Phyllobacteriaceae bacterium]